MDSPYDLASFALILLSAGLGGIIGFEREFNDKPAGLRTHMFVAAGSTLLVLLAEGAVDFFQEHSPDDQLIADPVRIIQAIVIGISFLGAGTIVHHRGSEVEGLTTAASVFLTAGIGIAVGVGRLWLAVEVAVFAVLLLLSARWVEVRWLGKRPPEEHHHSRDSDS